MTQSLALGSAEGEANVCKPNVLPNTMPSVHLKTTDAGVPEADLKWGGHGSPEVSWAPKGPSPGKKLKIKTKILISGHFSELHVYLHCTRQGVIQWHCTTLWYMHIIYAHAMMYMIAL